MALSEKLVERRNELGITQQELSRITGVSQAAISMFEHGTKVPSVGVLVLLAEALECSVDYLLGHNHNQS